MNKISMIIITTIAVIILSFVLISGCTSATPGKKDAKIIFLDAIKKSKSVTSSEASYDATINAGGIALNLKTDSWRKESITRADISGSLMGVPLVARYYNIQAGAFTCIKTNDAWECQEGSEGEVPGMTGPMSLEGEDETALLDMISKGIIVISLDTTESTIADRKCDNVDIIINATKFSGVTGESELMRTIEEMKNSNVSELSLIQCLDQATGSPLYFKMSMNEAAATSIGAGEQEVSFELTATKYSPNPSISDEIFTLPAEVKSE